MGKRPPTHRERNRRRKEESEARRKRAFAKLIKGNARFVEDPSYAAQRQRTADEGQHPIAAIVGCSDSALPPW